MICPPLDIRSSAFAVAPTQSTGCPLFTSADFSIVSPDLRRILGAVKWKLTELDRPDCRARLDVI
jgi:hypothetical protein